MESEETLKTHPLTEDDVKTLGVFVITRYDQAIPASNKEEHEKVKERVELEKHHLFLVYSLSSTFAEEVKLQKREKRQLEAAAIMHDLGKLRPYKEDEEELLMHAYTGGAQAEAKLKMMGIDELDVQTIHNAILRHQGMPYVERRREAKRNTALHKKIIQKYPEINSIERFLPPNDRVSAILYAADLLALGITHLEDEDPKAGGFDKIVQINLEAGHDLKEAIKSAYKSLETNVERLQTAAPYTEDEKEKLRELGFGEEEFQGREEAATIERELGNSYGQLALNKIKKLVETLDASEEKYDSTMDSYYELAKKAAETSEKS